MSLGIIEDSLKPFFYFGHRNLLYIKINNTIFDTKKQLVGIKYDTIKRLFEQGGNIALTTG